MPLAKEIRGMVYDITLNTWSPIDAVPKLSNEFLPAVVTARNGQQVELHKTVKKFYNRYALVKRNYDEYMWTNIRGGQTSSQ